MEIEGSAIPEQAIAALRQGQKIEAIKLTREATSMGLKESKEAVEAYLDSNRGVRESFDSAQTPLVSGSLLSLVTAAALITAAVWWVLFRDG